MIELWKLADGGIIAKLDADEVIKLVKDEEKKTAVFLPYTHVSQLGVGASQNRNDCGVACVVSVIRERGYSGITVDEVAAKYQKKNTPMRIRDVMRALLNYGIPIDNRTEFNAVDIADHIKSGKFVIALVAYELLPYNAFNYKTPHFILCYGVDSQGIYYHDPLSDGRQLRISFEQMERALVSGRNNQPYQAIVQK